MSDTANPSTAGISRTCIYIAAGRAIGAREPDPSARNPDYLAEKLLGDPSTLNVDHPAVRALSLGYDEAMKDVEVVSNVRMMIVRTRFIDEALERAIAGGATQVVILGAGFDSHAYRCQELLAHVRVFEVDRPATQVLKKQRVNEVLGGPPANLTYVAIDFQHEDLADVLARHGYDPAQRTFFILEGVTMYLPEEGVRAHAALRGGASAGQRHRLRFRLSRDDRHARRHRYGQCSRGGKPFVQRFLDLIKDEPWVFGLPVGRRARRFSANSVSSSARRFTIGGEESLKRYLTKADGTQVGAQAIAEAMARMAQRARDDRAVLARGASDIARAHARAAADDGLPTRRSYRALVGNSQLPITNYQPLPTANSQRRYW